MSRCFCLCYLCFFVYNAGMNDQKTRSNIAYIAIILILMVGVGYYIYAGGSTAPEVAENGGMIENSEEDIADVKEGDASMGEKVSTGDTSAEDVPQVTIDAPDLNRPIEFLVELPVELQNIYRTRIEKLTADLVLDSSAVGNWIDLGIQRKGIGDYEGAREVWEYVNRISPMNNVSFFNLGDLYHFYLKDFEKAEQNFIISKQNNPSYTAVYRALHELYKYSYKQNTSSAVDILLEGLENTDNNPDLMILLASYYKENGDFINARSWYEAARDQGLKDGKQSFADLLQEEIDNL